MTFSIGDQVFAKVKGYPYWPGIIDNILKEHLKSLKYEVLFFGSKDRATVKEECLCHYLENKNTYGKIKTDNFKNKLFNAAINEAELYERKNQQMNNKDKREFSNPEDSPSIAAELSQALLKENEELRQALHETSITKTMYELELEDNIQEKEEQIKDIITQQQEREKESNILIETLKNKLEAEKHLNLELTRQIDNDMIKLSNEVRTISSCEKCKIYKSEAQNMIDSIKSLEVVIEELKNENLSLQNRLKRRNVPNNSQNEPNIYKNAETQTIDIGSFSLNCLPSLPLSTVNVLEKRVDTLEHIIKELEEKQKQCNSIKTPETLKKTKLPDTPGMTKGALNNNPTTARNRKLHNTAKNRFSISLQVAKARQDPITLANKLNTQDWILEGKGKLSNCVTTQQTLITSKKPNQTLVEAQVHHPLDFSPPKLLHTKGKRESSVPTTNETKVRQPPLTATKWNGESYEELLQKHTSQSQVSLFSHPDAHSLTTTSNAGTPLIEQRNESTSSFPSNRYFLVPTYQKKHRYKLFKTRFFYNSQKRQRNQASQQN